VVGHIASQDFFLPNLASSETKQRPKIELKNAKAQQKGAKNLRK
jgi:hypothetical protein